MNLELSEEQQMLQDMVARYLSEHHDFDRRRAISGSAQGYSSKIWKALAVELGLLGASFPEECGGLGGASADMTVIARELGRALVTSPYVPTVVIAGGLLSRASGDHRAALASIVTGDMIVAYCDGANGTVVAHASGDGHKLTGKAGLAIGAPWADRLMVSARDATGTVKLFMIDAGTAGIARQDHVTIDGGRASDIRFDAVVTAPGDRVMAGDDAAAHLAAVLDEAAVVLAAEACGILRKMLADSLDYARQRQQFGRPIGAFQAIQHRLVDMFMDVEQAEAATMLAALRMGKADGSVTALAAKVQVAHACRKVGQGAIQIHGGIGITDELALGHYFRRATMIERLFGSIDANAGAYAQLNAQVVQMEDAA